MTSYWILRVDLIERTSVYLTAGDVLLTTRHNSSKCVFCFCQMLPNELTENVVLPPGDGDGERIVRRVSSRLHLWPVQDSHAGRYQCIATNALGSSYSTRASITVNGMSTWNWLC